VCIRAQKEVTKVHTLMRYKKKKTFLDIVNHDSERCQFTRALDVYVIAFYFGMIFAKREICII